MSTPVTAMPREVTAAVSAESGFWGNSPATAHPTRHYDVEEANTEGVASVYGLWPCKHKRSGGINGEI